MNFVFLFAVKILKMDGFRDFENFDLLNYIIIYFLNDNAKIILVIYKSTSR